MKASNYYYQGGNWRDRVATRAAIMALLFGIVPLMLVTVAAFGAPADSDQRAILSGPLPGPCAGASLGADYAGGADAYGRPVPNAGVAGAAAVQLDSETVYADVKTGAHGGSRGDLSDVAVDVRGLGRAMAAEHGCSPSR